MTPTHRSVKSRQPICADSHRGTRHSKDAGDYYGTLFKSTVDGLTIRMCNSSHDDERMDLCAYDSSECRISPDNSDKILGAVLDLRFKLSY